jgi:uncharacterized protein with PIN domain
MPPAASTPHVPAAEPRFAADAMLVRLARWLRTLGFDTTLDPALADPELVRQADQQDRVLLTRDRLLLRDLRPRRALEVHDDAPLAQLREVVTALSLPAPAELFTRCTVCNTPLSPPLDAARREALLPADVRTIGGPARQCPGCGRVYWQGSHARRMREAIERTLPGWLAQL